MGFGNPVRSDDAIGCYVIEQLQNHIAQGRPDCTLLDMGTGAFEVLFKLKGHSKIIIVDAVVNSKEEIGSIFKVPAEEIMNTPEENPKVFLHSMKWDQALSYAKKILGEQYPNDITVYLVAIEDTRLEVQMSEAVRLAGKKVVGYILEEIAI